MPLYIYDIPVCWPLNHPGVVRYPQRHDTRVIFKRSVFSRVGRHGCDGEGGVQSQHGRGLVAANLFGFALQGPHDAMAPVGVQLV